MRYVRQKFVQLVVVLLAVTILTFIALWALPGDPVTLKLGPGATPDQIAKVKKQDGFDKPLPLQYVIWLKKTATLDLGVSVAFNTPVKDLIQQRLPVSLVLMGYAMFFSLALSVPIAVYAAYRRDGPFDRISSTTAFGFLSMPPYIVAALLLYFFAVRWKIFPALSTNVSLFDDPVKHFKAYFLPSVTLALGQLAVFMRLLRTDMVATLQNDFITMARAKGMSTSRILFRHALRPSSFSILTAAAVSIGTLIGGAIIVEQIFNLPGMGQLVFEAISRRDFPVVQTCVVIFACGFVFANFLVDLLYAVLDPRIRHARALA